MSQTMTPLAAERVTASDWFTAPALWAVRMECTGGAGSGEETFYVVTKDMATPPDVKAAFDQIKGHGSDWVSEMYAVHEIKRVNTVDHDDYDVVDQRG